MGDKPIIAVWFSCGAASAVAAIRTVEKYSGEYDVRILNNPVIEEENDNLRFLRDVEIYLGKPIEKIGNPAYPKNSTVDVWNRTQYISGISGASCTKQLKREARRIWSEGKNVAYHVLGFTYDEQNRHDNFIDNDVNLLPVLINEKITKQDCVNILSDLGIKLPNMYRLGYPNANCIGCVKATSPTYWNKVRQTHPEVFAARAEQSENLGVRLVRVKGERIFLSDLDENAKGRPLKSLSLDCGVFCEQV